MYPYKYELSLRVFHPDADLKEIGTALGLVHQAIWKKGDPKTSLQGKPLKGLYDQSFVCFDLGGGESESDSFQEFLWSALDKLWPHRSLLREARKSGGRVEIYVSVKSSGGCFGETIPYELLQYLGKLELNLILDTISFHAHRK